MPRQLGQTTQWFPSTVNGARMFEYDQDIVETLLESSDEFQALYKQHHDLKEKVRDAELGVHPMDDLTLGHMKKEKLLAKDRMAALIDDYRRSHASA